MKRFLPGVGLGALVLFLIISFWIDADNTAQGGAIDLRNRITGARLMSDGTDPYTYKWTDGNPEIYCDPYNNPHLPVSKTTSTPTLLVLTMPFATLPYRSGQYVWFLAQWLLLLGTGWLWWRECRTRWQRALFGTLFTAFTYTAAWRLHAERGQSYVVLAFFLALWLAWTLRTGKGWAFLAGFAAGVLALLRPPCALLLPVLAWRRRDQMAGMGLGLLAGVIVPLFFMGGIWNDYGSAMQQQSQFYRENYNPRPGKQVYPPLVENIPLQVIAFYVPISYSDYSAHALLRQLGAEPAPALPVFLAAAIPFAAWCWWALRRRDLPHLLLGLACWMFLLDLFVPAYRNIYNDVLALNFTALGILIAPRFWPPLVATALALAAGIAVYIWSPVVAWQIDASSFLVTIGAVLWLFAPGAEDGLALDRTAASRQNRKC